MPRYAGPTDPLLSVGRLRALAVGEALQVPPNGYVRKKKQNDFVLVDRDNNQRIRGGTAEEIVADANFYFKHWRLPPPLGEPW